MRRALVLGGGGVVGVAWESGLLAGLHEGGVDVRGADLVIGTSAGSIVGTRIAAGHDPADLLSETGARGGGAAGADSGDRSAARAEAGAGRDGAGAGVDPATLARIFQLWGGAESMTEALCREIGRLADDAPTIPESAFIDMIALSTRVPDWPERPLRVTAVDVESGAFETHDRASGVPLAAAVAASCAVPGIFPTVPIGPRRFMDGGVRSPTSADLALEIEPSCVLIVAPICGASAPGIGRLADRQMAAEVAALRAAGCRVAAFTPGPDEVGAFGGSLMNPQFARASAEVGHRRGLELAKNEALIWNG